MWGRCLASSFKHRSSSWLCGATASEVGTSFCRIRASTCGMEMVGGVARAHHASPNIHLTSSGPRLRRVLLAEFPLMSRRICSCLSSWGVRKPPTLAPCSSHCPGQAIHPFLQGTGLASSWEPPPPAPFLRGQVNLFLHPSPPYLFNIFEVYLFLVYGMAVLPVRISRHCMYAACSQRPRRPSDPGN